MVHFDGHGVYAAHDVPGGSFTLRNYATFGDRAVADTQRTQGLIERGAYKEDDAGNVIAEAHGGHPPGVLRQR